MLAKSRVPRLFGELSEPARALALASGTMLSLAPNTVVYYQEDRRTAVYFVLSGHVRLTHINEDGSIALYAILPTGHSFGEAGPFDEGGHADTATSIDAAELFVLDPRGPLGDRPEERELRAFLVKLLARRLRAHVDATRALYMPNLSGRLAMSLLRLIDVLGNPLTYKGQRVECLGPIVTQRDLGAMARGTRENVNKMMRSWINEEIIAVEDRHIILMSRPRLEALAFGE